MRQWGWLLTKWKGTDKGDKNQSPGLDQGGGYKRRPPTQSAGRNNRKGGTKTAEIENGKERP